MRHKTRVMTAAAAVAAMLAAGGTASALAATGGATPGVSATATAVPVTKIPPVRKTPGPGDDLAGAAAKLGIPLTRLEEALRAVKLSFRGSTAPPSPAQFEAALARALGIPVARVERAFPAGTFGGTKPGQGKKPGAPPTANPGNEPLAAAIAKELHLSVAQVNAAMRPLFAAGSADPSSPAFAAAARALGVSTGQLATAIMQAKQGLAGPQPNPKQS